MRRACCTLTAIGLSVVLLDARELKPATLAQYDRYVALTEARMEAAGGTRLQPLWIDGLAEPERAGVMERLHRGEVVMQALETRDNGKTIAISGGLIHHWVGTVLMPGVSVEQVGSLVRDYQAYPTVFHPLIQRTAVQQRSDTRYVVTMRTYVKKVVTVVIDGTYDVEYVRRGPGRAETKTIATNLFEVHNAGGTNETREPGDRADGYLWRLRMYCTLDERADGSLDQCETISLTRDAPFAMSWLMKPFISAVPRETLAFMLAQVRRALVP